MIGAAIFQSLDFFVSKTPIGDKTNIVMGLVFAIIILIARRGIVGELMHRLRPSVVLPFDDEEPVLDNPILEGHA
jgi:ABC-type branched-subunit amino acid transport system permease subunit